MEEGMSADAALEHVRKTYEGEMMVATNRLESFDTLILNKLNAILESRLLQICYKKIQMDWTNAAS
jgi:hypothetical protein